MQNFDTECLLCNSEQPRKAHVPVTWFIWQNVLLQVKNKKIKSGSRRVRAAKVFSNRSNSCSCFYGLWTTSIVAIRYTWWKVKQFVNTSHHPTWKGKTVIVDLCSGTKHSIFLQMWVWWRPDQYCGQWERVRKPSSGFNELLSCLADSHSNSIFIVFILHDVQLLNHLAALAALAALSLGLIYYDPV